MGLLRNLMGSSSSSVKSAKSSPALTETDFGSPLQADVSEKAESHDGENLAGLSLADSPMLDRTRTIRQVDYRGSSDGDSPIERRPINRAASDSPRPRIGRLDIGSSSHSTIDPPPYQSPPRSTLRPTQSYQAGLESPPSPRIEEQARIKGEKRARRRSAEGLQGDGLGLGLGIGVNGRVGSGQAKYDIAGRNLQGSGDEKAIRQSGRRREAGPSAVVGYQTTHITTVTTTTTTTTQIIAIPQRTVSAGNGAPTLPPLPPTGSPITLSPSFNFISHFPRQSSLPSASMVAPLEASPNGQVDAVHIESMQDRFATPPLAASTSARFRSHGCGESADLPPLPGDKSLPKVPSMVPLSPASSVATQFSPTGPDRIVITPSTPARPMNAKGDSSGSTSRSEEDELEILGRRGTIKPDGRLWVEAPAEKAERSRKLRHVRSLGIGTPSPGNGSEGPISGRDKTIVNGDAVLVQSLASGSTASLNSGLSVSFGDVHRSPRSNSPGSGFGSARTPSPVSSLFGKLRGASQPSPSLTAARSESLIGTAERGPKDGQGRGGTSQPKLRKAKSFSSFMGRAEHPTIVPALPSRKAEDPVSRDTEEGQEVLETPLATDSANSMSEASSSADSASKETLQAEAIPPHPPTKPKLLRGPSGWFSSFRKGSQRDKRSAMVEAPIEMAALGSEALEMLTETQTTPTTALPMAIPQTRITDFGPTTPTWYGAHSRGLDNAPTSAGKQSAFFSPVPGFTSPGIAISPRSDSLGYFPSISEYSTTSSRVPSAKTTPAVTPGVPEIVTSSSSSSFLAKGAMPKGNAISQAGSGHKESPLPELSLSLGGPIMFKRPRTPERSRITSDTPEYTSRGQSLESADPAADFGQVEAQDDRPALGNRSNSTSSFALDRMKSMIAKTGARSRSSSVLRTNSLLASPQAGSGPRQAPDSPSGSTASVTSSYGTRLDGADSPLHMESFGSSRRSSFLWQPNRSRASSTADSAALPVLEEVGPAAVQFSPVVALASPKASLEVTREVASEAGSITAPRKKRARASTLFTTRPSSPTRAKSSGSLLPPPKPSRKMSTTFFKGSGDNSDSKSPGHSGSTTPAVAPTKPARILPAKQDADGPAEWLKRLLDVVERAELANVLASKNDPFFAATLEIFMQSFDFVGVALDIALRKLLMVASLPRETQQIDRVMDAFAKSYVKCNPGLYLDPDHAYVIAFSMIMLHTDVFNKNNKRKMTKQDYTRNTRTPGVSSLILETFYDNTCYTPFRFIEDDAKSSLLAPQSRDRSASTTSSSARGSKLDIYNLLSDNKLEKLKVNVLTSMSEEDPVSYHGSRPFFEFEAMRELFRKAPSMEVARAGTGWSTGSKSPQTKSGESSGDERAVVVTLKIVKVGLLSRKDDLSDGTTKAANRKWRGWSVLLTASQIIFIREPTWAISILDQVAKSPVVEPSSTEYLLPKQNEFRPEEVVTLSSAFAVYDSSYTKYPNSFRLVLPQGRQYILQASDEFEMNEWVAAINWASTFKTSGIAMFPAKATRGPSSTLTSGSNGGATNARRHAHEQLMDDLKEDGLDSATIEAAMTRGLHWQAASPEATMTIQATGMGSPEVEVNARFLLPRTEAISIKISEYRNTYIPLEQQVEEESRIAKSLDILTPFEKATRDKIEASVPLMSAKLHRLRVQLAAYRCWIDVLEADLARTARDGR